MDRTNEELAIAIKGGDCGAVPILWEQVKRLIYQQANRYLANNAAACAGAGVCIEDLEQAGFLALLAAVKAWTPESGYKLLAYLTLPLKTEYAALLGTRTQKRNALNQATSLDAEIQGTEDFTLADTVPDESAAKAFEDVEQRAYLEQLRVDIAAALEHISEGCSEVIRAYYLQGKTESEIAEGKGCSHRVIRTLRNKGLRDLRRGEARICLKSYRADIIGTFAYRSGFTAYKHSGYSSTELAAEKLAE